MKAITRGFTYKVLPITWSGRTAGVSSFKIKEMGSRYMYVVLNIWLERLLTHADMGYSRKHIAAMRGRWREACSEGLAIVWGSPTDVPERTGRR